MAKKRGGLAGLYDRNKGLFRAAAILGGTALGGPAGGAAAGAAMRGLDREGKRGIGFDVGQGIRGGIEGYAMGKTAQSVGSGIKGMLTGGGAKAAPMAMQAGSPPPFDFSNVGIGMPEPSPVFNFDQSPVANIPGLTDASGNMIQQGRLSQLLKGAKSNWDVISGTAKGIGGVMNYQQQQRLAEQEAAREAARQRREDEEFALRKGELERQRASRERLTQMLLPLFQANLRGLAPDQYRLPQG